MTNKNLILNNLYFINQFYHEVNKKWKEDIESSGYTFDYSSQKINKNFIDSINSFKYKNKIESNELVNEKEIILTSITNSIKENIKLYEKYRSFFNSLNRDELMVDYYRKLKETDQSSKELTLEISNIIDSEDSKDFVYSEVYHNYAFLCENYHQTIYRYSKDILNQIENDFKYDIPYKPSPLKNNKKEFFNLKLIGEIYDICNGILFEPLPPLDFYKEINFLHTFQRFKKIEGQNNNIYYLINQLRQSIDNPKRKKLWVITFLDHLELSFKTYESKKNFITSKEASEISRKLSGKIEAGVNKYK
jgi:hypothetical protein